MSSKIKKSKGVDLTKEMFAVPDAGPHAPMSDADREQVRDAADARKGRRKFDDNTEGQWRRDGPAGERSEDAGPSQADVSNNWRRGGAPAAGDAMPVQSNRADETSNWRGSGPAAAPTQAAADDAPSWRGRGSAAAALPVTRVDDAPSWRREAAPATAEQPVPVAPSVADSMPSWRGSSAPRAAPQADADDNWRARGRAEGEEAQPKKWFEEKSGLSAPAFSSGDRFGARRTVGSTGPSGDVRRSGDSAPFGSSGPAPSSDRFSGFSSSRPAGEAPQPAREFSAAFGSSRLGGDRQQQPFEHPRREMPTAFAGPNRFASLSEPGGGADADGSFTCQATGEKKKFACLCDTCRKARPGQTGRAAFGGSGSFGSFGRGKADGGDRFTSASSRHGSGGGGGGSSFGSARGGDVNLSALPKGPGEAAAVPVRKMAPVAAPPPAAPAPKPRMTDDERKLAVASFTTLLKRKFDDVSDIVDAEPETAAALVKATAREDSILPIALGFIAGLACATPGAKDRRALLGVLVALRNAKPELFSPDVVVHELERSLPSARAGASKLVELTQGLVAAGVVSTAAISGSPLLRDFFSEHGGSSLLGDDAADAEDASSAPAAASAPVADASAVQAAADVAVSTGAVGDALADAVREQLSDFPAPQAAAAIVRAVVKAVTAAGTFDKPEWTAQDAYGAGLAVLLYDDSEEGTVDAGKTAAAVAGLCEIQAACAAVGMPRGLIQSLFVQLHQNDVVTEAGFFGWRDDAAVSTATAGKQTALIQLNKWMEWLGEDDEESDDDEGEESEEDGEA